MKHIVSTIPKGRYKSWESCLADLKYTDGEYKHGYHWFWLINTSHLPKDIKIGESVCYMVWDGLIRGYFDIVDTDTSEAFRSVHNIGKKRVTYGILMANWHPCSFVPMKGFQGWRYTQMRP